ncbi:MAG: branched-chain amino acid ABC transporter substrate-binding protein [Solirubrobacteraceae bacterium]
MRLGGGEQGTVKRGSLGLMLLAVVVVLAGCGSDHKVPNKISGQTLTIYASVPLHGASAVSGQAVLGGAKIALDQVRGRIGRYRIVLRWMDDSTAKRGTWDPGQTTLNAHQAMDDHTTIGYIGEYNSGASAISIPLLNRMGIPQISPTSTAVGLTSHGIGAAPGEPEKYYPTGIRTYARVVPSDAIEATAQVRLQQAAGCNKTFILDDGEFDGDDAEASFQVAARAAHLKLAGVQMFDPRVKDYRPLAAAVAKTGADCVLISAITEDNAVLLTKQVAEAMPNAKLFGTGGLAESTFANPEQGGIPRSLDSRVLITAAALGPAASPPSGQAFYDRYRLRYGEPEPYAIFGYEAMSLMLSAIARATDDGTEPAQRSKVRAAIFATRGRRSVLGTYSIKPDGDTTLRRYGVYHIVGGRLRFWGEIDA